ncbi:MAG: peptidyl-prolyl cis-trans isomerase [Myxococcota bacterium]|nr:peptidyl-prolyl cis-trans isomerase [Myxococcota bacterium]
MQRLLTAVVGVAAVVVAVWVVVRSVQAPAPTSLAASAKSSSMAGEEKDTVLSALGDAAHPDKPDKEGGALLLSDLAQSDLRPAGAGSLPGSGVPVPRLPFSAPRQVRFGVIVVSFTGAQPNPGERPPTRSVADAKSLADNLMATATHDFHSAVQQGDPGSTEDIGRVRLGVLEPAPEYVLFTLPVGGVGGPVETPRGFWIVKRLE